MPAEPFNHLPASDALSADEIRDLQSRLRRSSDALAETSAALAAAWAKSDLSPSIRRLWDRVDGSHRQVQSAERDLHALMLKTPTAARRANDLPPSASASIHPMPIRNSAKPVAGGTK